MNYYIKLLKKMNRNTFFGFTLLLSSIYFMKSKQNFKSNLNLIQTLEVQKETCALCILNPHNSTASGLVIFKQRGIDSPVEITGTFKGLKKEGKHGFHIHEWGDLTDGCTTAGPHYNPTNMTHGGPNDKIRHVGDLGNVEADHEGNAKYSRTDDVISLVGKYSIVGRSCVVHADQDDLGRGNFEDSKTTGHSGARIACGVIALCDPDRYK